MDHIARIPASITIATEERSHGRKLLWPRGDVLLKIELRTNFAYVYAFAIKIGLKRMYDLKGHLTYDFDFAFAEKEIG